MKIRQASSFRRSLRKLTTRQKKQIVSALAIFVSDPFDPRLRNHKLKGKQEEVRSFSAGYDLRILYEERGNHATVILIKAGSHEQVYK